MYHSWGGHCVEQDGVYHGYFSFILGHCTLSTWKTNSALLHGVASAPEGPYRPAGRTVYPAVQGVEVPPWAHSAFIVPASNATDNLYLLWHIGNASTPASLWKECGNNSRDHHDDDVPQEVPQEVPSHTCNPEPCGESFYVHTSTSPAGPWGAPMRLNLTANALRNAWWAAAQQPGGTEFRNNPSMPAPFVFANGTTLVYYQAKNCPRGWGNLAPACVGVLRAPTWRGPYDIATAPLGQTDLPIVHPESEDPFVFRTRRGFHLLTNVNTYHKRCAAGVACGGHAWSRDGLVWSEQDVSSFGPTITLSDKNRTVVRNSYVERPQVYQDPATLEPITLFVGLTRPDGYADSVSWAQPFCAPGDVASDCGTTI